MPPTTPLIARLALLAPLAALLSLVGCASGPPRDPSLDEPVPAAARFSTSLHEAPITIGEPAPFGDRVYRAGRLYIAGTPDERTIDRFARAGGTHVIDLRGSSALERLHDDDSPYFHWINHYGLDRTHIPLSTADGYAPEDLDAFTDTIARIDGTLLLHCASGGRSRFMWKSYLIRERGMPPEDAEQLIRTLGGKPTSVELLLGTELNETQGSAIPQNPAEESARDNNP